METIIEQLETEAAEVLRANGEVVYAQAAQNLAWALHLDLITIESAAAARYVIDESMAANRTVEQNLGALVCLAS